VLESGLVGDGRVMRNAFWDVVGEYEGRPLLVLGRTNAGRKAGPAIQSSRRERNPKDSRWLLCARAELCAAAGI